MLNKTRKSPINNEHLFVLFNGFKKEYVLLYLRNISGIPKDWPDLASVNFYSIDNSLVISVFQRRIKL